MNYPDSSGPLMTPPVSPAGANRGSVINQGPMAVRSLNTAPAQLLEPCQVYSDPLYYPPSSSYPTTTPTPSYQVRPECTRYTGCTSSCTPVPYTSRTLLNGYGATPECQSVQLMDSGGFEYTGDAGEGSGPVYTSTGHIGESCYRQKRFY